MPEALARVAKATKMLKSMRRLSESEMHACVVSFISFGTEVQVVPWRNVDNVDNGAFVLWFLSSFRLFGGLFRVAALA